jgi:hypothetical protein
MPTYTPAKKRMPTEAALAKRETEKKHNAKVRAYEKWFALGEEGKKRVSKRHSGEEMSKKYTAGLETAHIYGGDDWRTLEICCERFVGRMYHLEKRDDVLAKNVKIVERLVTQDQPPADLAARKANVDSQLSNHGNDLLGVMLMASQLYDEIEHWKDELKLANAEHLAWLLDGTPCQETVPWVALNARLAAGLAPGNAPRAALGNAPRAALAVKAAPRKRKSGE